MSDHDGGPAFPVPHHEVNGQTEPVYIQGMTLRDWFAGQALAMLGDSNCHLCASDTAGAAYKYADAMLVEREIDQ